MPDHDRDFRDDRDMNNEYDNLHRDERMRGDDLHRDDRMRDPRLDNEGTFTDRPMSDPHMEEGPAPTGRDYVDDSNVDTRPLNRERDMDHPEMRATKLSDIKGKSILNTHNGQRLGQVDDVLIDPHSMTIAGLVIAKGSMFAREHHIVPASDVETWGRDAVLVRGDNVFFDQAEVPNYENFISLNDRLNGLSVVSTHGDRLGQVSEVLVDHSGQLVAYLVSEGMGGFGGDTFEIPAMATRTLGKDVAIVDYAPRRPRDE
jgi:uncharacterized protein YrrD